VIKKGAAIPIRCRESKEILSGYFDDFPVDKYLICIDSIGLRSRRTAGFLLNEGYRALYVEGGIDMFKPIAKDELESS
jgi:rhodanese-related sulfurtransferase